MNIPTPKLPEEKEERLRALKAYYRKDSDIARLRRLYRTGSYDQALQELISYIAKHETDLRLKLGLMEGNAVDRFLNDYEVSENHCVIRSPRQVEALLRRFTGPDRYSQQLKRLNAAAEKESRFLLLLDILDDKAKMFRELFHELNAWLSSGCTASERVEDCLRGDWRTFLRDQQHRELDEYVYGTGRENHTVSLQQRIILLLRRLASHGRLKSFIPIRRGEGVYIYMAAARPAGSRSIIKSYGVSFVSRELAMVKCLSELVERLSSRWDRRRKPILLAPSSLGERNHFESYFSKKQLGRKFGWVEGRRIPAGKRMIPAQFIYADYRRYHREESVAPFTGIGSGVAAGKHTRPTIMNAVYELIERDALVTGYLNRSVPKRLSEASLKTSPVGSFLRAFAGRPIQVYMLDITNDLGVPSFMTLIVEEDKRLVACGVKSGIDPAAALRGSAEESYLEWVIKKENIGSIRKRDGSAGQSPHLVPAITFENYRSLLDNPEMVPFTAGSHTLSEKEEFDLLIGGLRRKGREVLYKDITPDWLAPVSKVLRVFIPSLQPLYFTKNQEWVNHERLRQSASYFENIKP